MIKASLLLVLLLLVAPLSAQQLTLSDEELQDTALLTTLNNYFGCKVWSKDACLQCSDRYFFNSKGICCEVQGTCQQFNTQQGICQKCYEGYSVVNGKCEQVTTTTQDNIGCAVWKNGACSQCSKRWYFNSNNVCVPVSDLCSTWDDASGACQSCYYGYKVEAGACVANNDVSIVPNSNLLCKTWSGSTCVECADRTFFNADGICTSVSALCNTFDKASGNCLTCFQGYDLSEGKCVDSPSNTAKPADLGCGEWDWKNQKCLSCSKRWAFNNEGVCVPVSDQCSAHDNAGLCSSCYKGYDLKDGQCLFSSSNNAHPADSGCGTWDWDSQKCLSCSNGWVFNADKVCVAVSDQCKAHAENGDCTECYHGYDLKEGKCVFSDSNNAKPSDLGCGTWDWNKQVCLKCSSGWFFNSEKACVPVSDQCKSNVENGDCDSCYSGYDLKDGKCIFSDFNNAKPADSGCGTWDWFNQKCLKCSDKWVFNSNNVCVPVSDQCKAHAENGDCTSCFFGYDLKEGKCVFSDSNNAKPSDSGCGTWDWNGQKCLKCSDKWVFNGDGVCVPVSDQCKAHAENGDCTSCFKGYDVKEGKCVFSDSNNAKPSDSGCGTWDWDNQKCLACSKDWVFNSEGVCVPVSDQCKTHGDNGDCTTCFKGYDLKEGKCVFSDSNNAKPSDSGCGTWDWDNQKCLSCSNGWVFNADKVCVPVSDQCKAHAENGDCTSCYKGYDLKDGKCLFSDSNNAKPSDSGCGTWDWDNQKCLKCSSGWVFNSESVCVPVSDQCKTHADNGDCTSCYKGYDVKSGQCVFSDSNNAKPSDSGCGTWDWDNQKCLSCSKDWVFNSEGVCVPVSDQCKSHADNGDCTSCYKGYDLKDGKCVFSESNNAKPSDSGCGTWDWDSQKCLKCSSGWVFNGDGICVPVSDQCKTHAENGDCTTCFKGYDLKDGKCIFSDSNNAKPSDSGCGTWDWDNQKCLSCSKNWVFNSEGVCVPVSDQCKSHADNGDCLTCYHGYDLKEGKCVFSDSNNAHPSDSGCGTWDWNNQVCLSCSKDWVFNDKKVCVPVSDQCKTHAENGDCTSCFKGYDLKNGQCVFSDSNNAKPSDSGCGTWDWDNQVCLSCSNGYVFNSKSVCVAVSDLCRTNAANGDCTACYEGYDLKDGKCVFSDSNNAHPSDLGCSTWDWKNQKCLKCSHRWFFNSNNKCVPVDDNCNQYADNGSCTSCYQGYGLSDGVCVSVNPLCKTLNADGTCASCYPQNIVHKGNCVPISKLANILLYYAECCPEKLQAIKDAQAGN